jgi:CRP-like cAMP-binding protein
MVRSAPLEGRGRSRVEVLEVLVDTLADLLEERHILYLFMELMATHHEDEQNEAQTTH